MCSTPGTIGLGDMTTKEYLNNSSPVNDLSIDEQIKKRSNIELFNYYTSSLTSTSLHCEIMF